MKIIFVGNGNLKSAGLRHFGYDTRIFNGLVRNGHCVYFFSDRDEVRQASPFRIFKNIGRRRTNQKLLDVVGNFRPDAIVLAHVDTIDTETFQEIRSRFPALRIAQVNVDPIFNSTNRANLLRRRDVVDATFITSGGDALARIGSSRNPAYFIPNFTDSSIDAGTAFERASTKYDVACFMHGDMGHSSDENARIGLANAVADLPGITTLYGGFNGIQSIRGHAYINGLGESAMGLNLSKHVSNGEASTAQTRYLYSSDRIAHFMGNGCLTFTQTGFGLERLYTAGEVVFFDEVPDLLDKVCFYKQHPALRQKVAKNGWLKAHRDFETTIVTKYILERLFDKPLSQDYKWPLDAFPGNIRHGQENSQQDIRHRLQQERDENLTHVL